jgi:hypothetical protein
MFGELVGMKCSDQLWKVGTGCGILLELSSFLRCLVTFLLSYNEWNE